MVFLHLQKERPQADPGAAAAKVSYTFFCGNFFSFNSSRRQKATGWSETEFCMFRGLVGLPPDPSALSSPPPAAFRPAAFCRDRFFAGAPSMPGQLPFSPPSLPSRAFPLLSACGLPCSVLPAVPSRIPLSATCPALPEDVRWSLPRW